MEVKMDDNDPVVVELKRAASALFVARKTHAALLIIEYPGSPMVTASERALAKAEAEAEAATKAYYATIPTE